MAILAASQGCRAAAQFITLRLRSSPSLSQLGQHSDLIMAVSSPASNGGELVKFESLRSLRQEKLTEKLEDAVDFGLGIVGAIEHVLGKVTDMAEMSAPLEPPEALKIGTRATPVIIGVVGSTGAGKSSIINAVLDEECLVPTSCMRACTAVITEIIYNESESEDEKYRADIYFISQEEWTAELQILLRELQSRDSQPGRDALSSDTEASIAYSKIHAVYPNVTKQDFIKSNVTVESLDQDTSVKDILGTTRHISAPTSKQFMEEVKKYVDSKEEDTDEQKRPVRMEYWPLVKIVKVFVKSPVLETGLALVDLVSGFIY